MVEAGARLAVVVEDTLDPGQVRDELPHRRRRSSGSAHVDVGDLVVGDGEGARRPRVEALHAVLRRALRAARPRAARG